MLRMDFFYPMLRYIYRLLISGVYLSLYNRSYCFYTRSHPSHSIFVQAGMHKCICTIVKSDGNDDSNVRLWLCLMIIIIIIIKLKESLKIDYNNGGYFKSTENQNNVT